MEKQYKLSEKQKEYVTDLIIKRQEELYKKAAIYQEIRKSERGISSRQISYENKVLAELSLIHTLLHQLYVDEYEL